MNKITRKQRLELLENGFYKCGYSHITNVEELTALFTRLEDQLTDTFADKVRATNTKLSIAKIRSKDFIDSEDCFYDFKGNTFQYGQFIVHVYSHAQSKSGTASVSLLAE